LNNVFRIEVEYPEVFLFFVVLLLKIK